MGEIRVKGKGNVTVVPDMVRMKIRLNGVEEEYEKSIKKVNQFTREIKDILVELGVNVQEIKTSRFEVYIKNERNYDKSDRWITVFKGYEYIHNMSVVFERDNILLGKTLKKLSQCNAKPELDLEYSVKDISKVKNELLKNAILDSKNRAQLLAEATENTLGNVKLIDYSWGELNLVSSPIEKFLDIMKLSDEDDFLDELFDMDIEPEDINISDTVTVVWELN